MQPFLRLVTDYIYLHHKDSVENLCIVLPSKRGAIFLRDYFKEVFQKTMWLPTIKSAEEFIEELSGLKQADEIDLIALLYESYLACYTQDPESFEKFSKWGHLMLQDFNEIDRYLIDSHQIYENLKDIKEIENWSLSAEELSITQQNYLAFMASIGNIYKHYSSRLVELGIGYQGLLYRVASNKFQSNLTINHYSKILFCGFNALNAAETKIYKWLQDNGKAEFLWDIDNYYYKNSIQEAGLFLRRNLETFPQKETRFINDFFRNKKTIEITAVAGQMGQAQLVHDELMRLMKDGIPMHKVALVLANEKLLWPVLKLLPQEVEHVNITMEYPIRYTQAFSFIDLLLSIQLSFQSKGKSSSAIYYKEFIGIIQHPFFGILIESLGVALSVNKIIDRINQSNFVFISQKLIQEFFNGIPELFSTILKPWTSSAEGNKVLIDLIENIRDYYIELYQNNRTYLELEYLEVLLKSFKRIDEVVKKYHYYSDIRSYRQLFTQTVGSSTVPFIGEPLRGLQIMGVLETRTLDFEYLIMVGVNEGILPSGKTVNSFLPNDLKRVFGLPLYYEKDAIYAYHFYRLLQRTTFAHLIYDSETDEMGKGEKSRFISQLQFELKQYNSNHVIIDNVAVSASPEYFNNSITINKSDTVLSKIIEKAKSNNDYGGLSPSALITFKECSLKYYFRYGAGLKEIKEVEESAEANTFGSILHLALENLYKPYINKVLTEEDVKQILNLLDTSVEQAFAKFFPDSSQLIGKNYLQVEVLKVYVRRLIDQDSDNIKELKKQNKHLTILFLEGDWQAPLELTINGNQETIYVKGKIDRIDKFGENIRVIDYKTSIKQSDKFVFDGFENLFENVDYNKQFQLFAYVWLLSKNKPEYLSKAVPGIIPFKKFLKKPENILMGKEKTQLVFNQEIMNDFEDHLKAFISKIVNPEIPFQQTNDLAICEYCGYKSICNR